MEERVELSDTKTLFEIPEVDSFAIEFGAKIWLIKHFGCTCYTARMGTGMWNMPFTHVNLDVNKLEK